VCSLIFRPSAEPEGSHGQAVVLKRVEIIIKFTNIMVNAHVQKVKDFVNDGLNESGFFENVSNMLDGGG